MNRSCLGCKFLYTQEEGYSNYTVTDYTICCALEKNPELLARSEKPCDWNQGQFASQPTEDNQDDLVDMCQDVEQLVVICEHSGRAPTIDRNNMPKEETVKFIEFQGQWLVWVEKGETTVFDTAVAAQTFAAIERSNNGSNKP